MKQKISQQNSACICCKFFAQRWHHFFMYIASKCVAELTKVTTKYILWLYCHKQFNTNEVRTYLTNIHNKRYTESDTAIQHHINCSPSVCGVNKKSNATKQHLRRRVTKVYIYCWVNTSLGWQFIKPHDNGSLQTTTKTTKKITKTKTMKLFKGIKLRQLFNFLKLHLNGSFDLICWSKRKT